MQHTILTDDQVRWIAPSVYSTGRDESLTSPRYSFLPTIEVIDALRTEGWQTVATRQMRTIRGSRNLAFTKHQVFLAHRNDLENYSYAKVCPRILLTNSHDGSSSFLVQAAVFRAACSNGLITPNGLVQEHKIRHSHRTVEHVVSAALALRSSQSFVQYRINQFQDRILTPAEQFDLANRGLAIRFGDELSELNVVQHEVLAARRSEDIGDDLWRVFNRVQESVVRGGFKVGRLDGTNRDYRNAKAITAIAELSRVNTQLWDAADGLVLPS